MKKETMIKMSILFEGVYLVTKREQSLHLYPDISYFGKFESVQTFQYIK